LNYHFSFSVVTNEKSAEKSADKGTEKAAGKVSEDKPVDKNVLVPAQEINLTRDFRFDPNNVLATAEEEEKVQQDLVKFAVRQMLRRIQSHLKQPSQ